MLLERDYEDWKCENFELYDEETEDLNEDLDIELDEVLTDFLNKTDYELYYRKMLNKMKK